MAIKLLRKMEKILPENEDLWEVEQEENQQVGPKRLVLTTAEIEALAPGTMIKMLKESLGHILRDIDLVRDLDGEEGCYAVGGNLDKDVIERARMLVEDPDMTYDVVAFVPVKIKFTKVVATSSEAAIKAVHTAAIHIVEHRSTCLERTRAYIGGVQFTVEYTEADEDVTNAFVDKGQRDDPQWFVPDKATGGWKLDTEIHKG